MEVRRARPEDAAALTAIAMASKQSNGYDDAFMAACADELTVTGMDIAAHAYWVAEDAGTQRGLARLDADGDEGEIHAFFIHPDHKRNGIGRALWQALLAEAKRQQLSLLKLDADPEAVPFYAALGFEVVGEKPSGSIPGRMLPHMQRRVEGASTLRGKR